MIAIRIWIFTLKIVKIQQFSIIIFFIFIQNHDSWRENSNYPEKLALKIVKNYCVFLQKIQIHDFEFFFANWIVGHNLRFPFKRELTEGIRMWRDSFLKVFILTALQDILTFVWKAYLSTIESFVFLRRNMRRSLVVLGEFFHTDDAG